ncbi:MAG TPA: hypothetical protein VNQ74_08220, partial [Burkholderiaceae bacterium]|nr:hypothetical protein [Burkholderiaceae bacterium]
PGTTTRVEGCVPKQPAAAQPGGVANPVVNKVVRTPVGANPQPVAAQPAVANPAVNKVVRTPAQPAQPAKPDDIAKQQKAAGRLE